MKTVLESCDNFEILFAKLAPFHEFLVEQSNLANELWTEGGMIWSFEYLHGSAHAVPRKLPTDSTQSTRPQPLSRYAPNWTTFIAAMSGCLEIPKERSEEFKTKAMQVITWFEALELGTVSMSFDVDVDSIDYKSVGIIGRHAIVHTAFWSID